jgi:E3 ubiquitin-protein ligase RNF14
MRVRRRNDHDVGLDEVGVEGELDPAHQEWVRQFVQLALNDQEHIFFEDDPDADI